jgi:outer membrane receptor protein involved in Fe transport
MMKRALPAVLGLLSLCLSLAAQEQTIIREELQETGATDVGPALSLYRPDIFSHVDSSVLIHGLPVLTLLDGRRFPISTELGRMGIAPLDIFPFAFVSAVDVYAINASAMYGTDSPGGVVNLRRDRFDTWGEVGLFYGRSSGKYGREDKAGYITGGVGNEHFQLNVGFSRQETTFDVPQRR